MNLTRRSFLRSLGAALLTPLLPKGEVVPEEDEYWTSIGTTDGPSVSSLTEDWDDEFAVADDYFLPNAWMRYPRAEWTWDPLDKDTFQQVLDDVYQHMSYSSYEPVTYSVIMHPDTFDWWYANVPWFRRAVDGFDV